MREYQTAEHLFQAIPAAYQAEASPPEKPGGQK
jgi:hypothetical protein